MLTLAFKNRMLTNTVLKVISEDLRAFVMNEGLLPPLGLIWLDPLGLAPRWQERHILRKASI